MPATSTLHQHGGEAALLRVLEKLVLQSIHWGVTEEARRVAACQPLLPGSVRAWDLP